MYEDQLDQSQIGVTIDAGHSGGKLCYDMMVIWDDTRGETQESTFSVFAENEEAAKVETVKQMELLSNLAAEEGRPAMVAIPHDGACIDIIPVAGGYVREIPAWARSA